MTSAVALAHTAPLIALVDHAASALYDARNAAEVIEAADLAMRAYTQAKLSKERAKRLIKARKAHDDLIESIHRVQGDALKIKSEAQRRIADEYDAAQQNGEVASKNHGGANIADGISEENTVPATVADLGLTSQQIFRAREVRDAEKAQPGIVAKTIDEAIEQGREPMAETVRKTVREVAGRKPINPRTEQDREFGKLKLIGEITNLKKQWSAATIQARRQFLRDVGLTDTPLIDKLARHDFKPLRWRKRGELDLTLAPISSLPVVNGYDDEQGEGERGNADATGQ